MINSIPYYTYQQNVQILKGFFSKPLTLICACLLYTSPSRAIGMTTGAPEVRPSRSSRTKDRAPQLSCAHDR